MIDRIAGEVMQREGVKIPYMVGTMIELPRAALLAGEIAKSAEFFSFGTNDLTQTVYGISRDDAAGFIGAYQKLGIIPHDPFVTLDIEGVGEMVRIAAERGRAARPGIKLGICGEHGGDPASIHFCRELGLDYVSCSPYRVPIARLAAAQAELAAEEGGGTA
jgi:pyruvate,orthophosphate dikinase